MSKPVSTSSVASTSLVTRLTGLASGRGASRRAQAAGNASKWSLGKLAMRFTRASRAAFVT